MNADELAVGILLFIDKAAAIWVKSHEDLTHQNMHVHVSPKAMVQLRRRQNASRLGSDYIFQ